MRVSLTPDRPGVICWGPFAPGLTVTPAGIREKSSKWQFIDPQEK